MDFAHLHVHTQYSLLDGAARIKDLIARCKELGMNSIAVTDHGSMYGVVEFYKECKAQGIKPILGCEVYICENMKSKERGRYAHLVLLAKNNTGYNNLMKLCTMGWIDGFYYKPRIDYDTLAAHKEGLVCLSACLAGDLPQLVFREDYSGAMAYVEKMKDMFGEDYYIELQDHDIPQEKMVAPRLIKVAQATDTPMVVTNDVHYVNREDSYAQDILLCIQTNAYVDDENRMRMGSDQMYLKAPDEMSELFPNVPEAMTNSLEIADKCNVELDFDTMHLPSYPVPIGMSAYDYLVNQARKGMDRLGLSGNKEYEDRLEYELGVIKSMGFVDYFLIVWDYVDYAKTNGIAVGPGRGSAAGSLCAYVLDITSIDPIKYNLIFERFLNPERISMPDIDIDFCTKRRQEVINYVIDKYGADRVAQIITFNTMAAKASIKDVARVMRYPIADANKLTKMIPNDLGMTIEKALVINKELKALYDGNEEVRNIIDISLKLEGLPRHAGTHAAGVVISKSPLVDFIPLQKNDEVITTQFTMGDVEQLGLLKMDFLALRNLNVIQDTIIIIRHTKGENIDIDSIPYDDKAVYEMISRGETDCVFQLESRGMRNFLKELRPDCFEDIIAGISLFRPGPMDQIPTYVKCKFHPDEVSYLHPKLEPILNMTYGCMVYQEQVMQIVRDLAGYSMGRSDLVRRAMAKKKQAVMDKEREIFISGSDKDGILGCVNNGVDRDSANKIFDQMTDFAQYAFNRSHAAAYGVLAYQTAYLKCHYPTEIYAATINSYNGDGKKVEKYIAACKQSGVKVVKPDVNISRCKFTVNDNKVVFGLLAIKNVGEKAAEEVVREREENGLFTSFYDFCKRCGKIVNKRMLESMIYVGCFDEFGHTRNALLKCYESLLDQINDSRKLEGQMSLFDMGGSSSGYDIPDVPELDEGVLLAEEKDRTGMYISGHPLEEYKSILQKYTTNSMALSEGEYSEGDVVKVGGLVTSKRNVTTKNNSIMSYIGLEDLEGRIEIVVFPKSLQQYSPILYEGNIIEISGKVNERVTVAPDGQESIQYMIVMEKVQEITAVRTLQIKMQGIHNEFIAGIQKGNDVIEIYAYVDGGWKKSVRNDALVDDNIINKAKELFGEKNIRTH